MENMKVVNNKDIVGWWEKEIKKQGVADWVNDIVVALHPGDLKKDSVRQVYADLFEGDVCDWYRGSDANWNDFMRHRGIRADATADFEFQESIGFDLKDTKRLFERNGIAVGFRNVRTGKGYGPSLMGNFGFFYRMDLIAPKWREMVRQGLLRQADFGDAVSSDNIYDMNGHYCQWNQAEFRRYLRRRFSPQKIAKLIPGELEYFDFRQYMESRVRRLRLKGKTDPELIDDDICREWVRFQYLANLSVWGEMVRDIKAEGLRSGRPVPAVWGNQVELCPYSVAQSRLVDVVWLELGMKQPYVPDSYHCSTAYYKLGRAAGGYRKPVWAVQWPGNTPNPGGVTEQIAMAEAAAQAGVAYTPAAWNNMPEGGKGYQKMQAFLARWRSLFLGRDAYARVALAYPMSAYFWKDYEELRTMEGWPHGISDCMDTMARVLEDLHIMFEVVIFGQPDVWNDQETFKRLSRYDALVLPEMECLSLAQEKAIRMFLKEGGTVLICGPLGIRDENFRVRKAPIWTTEERKHLITIPPEMMRSHLELRTKTKEPSSTELGKKVWKVLEGSNVIKTTAPRHTWVSAWLQDHNRRLSIHLVNYNLVIDKEKMQALISAVPPQEERERAVERQLAQDTTYAHLEEVKDMRLQVYVPSGVVFDRIRFIPFEGREVDLKYSVDKDGWVEMTVPYLHLWAIVVFTAGDELDTALDIARAKRAASRIEVARCKPVPEEVSEKIQLAQGAHARREFDKARQLAAEARRYSEETQKRIMAGVLDAERENLKADCRLCENAVIALDFGEGKPVPGWKRLGADTVYDAGIGFGWNDVLKERGVGRNVDFRCLPPALTYPVKVCGSGDTDALHGRYLCGQGETRLRIDLPDGLYRVIVLSGEGDGGGAKNWIGAGEMWHLLGERLAPGKLSRRSFITKSEGGCLILRLYGTGASPDQGGRYLDMPDWCIAGIAIHLADANAAQYPDIAGGTLRNWTLVGPFGDPGCNGMDGKYPREVYTTPVTMDGDEEKIAAQRYRWKAETQQGFAPVMLHRVIHTGYDPSADRRITTGNKWWMINNAYAYAATRVYAPATMEAKLWFGSTGLAVVWLNRMLLIRDKIMAGLEADEIVAPVKLNKGWNELLVRVCAWWGYRWMFTASLTTPSGKAIRELRCKADFVTSKQDFM